MHRGPGAFLLIRDTTAEDTEKLQGAAVERPDATVLLVAMSRSIQSVGSLHRKWGMGLTSNMVGGGLERFTLLEVSDGAVQPRRIVNATPEAQGCQGCK